MRTIECITVRDAIVFMIRNRLYIRNGVIHVKEGGETRVYARREYDLGKDVQIKRILVQDVGVFIHDKGSALFGAGVPAERRGVLLDEFLNKITF